MPNYEIVRMDPSMARGEPMSAGRIPEKTSTPRRYQVLNLLEHRNGEIAERLGISQSSVNNDLKLIHQELGTNDRIQAVVEGVNRGLINLGDKFPPDYDLSVMKSLTPAQRKIAESLGHSKSTNEAIAQATDIKIDVLDSQVHHITSKLGIKSRAQIALLYLEARRRARERLGPDIELTQNDIFGVYIDPRLINKMPRQTRAPRAPRTPTSKAQSKTPRTRRNSPRTPNPVGAGKPAERSGFLRNGSWAGPGGNEMDHRASITVLLDDMRLPEKTHDGDVYPQNVSSPLARLPYAMFMRRDGEPRYPTPRAAVESLNASHLEVDQVGKPLSGIARADKLESILAGTRMNMDRYFIPAVEAHREYFDHPTHLLAEKTPSAIKNFFEWVRKHYGDTLTFDQMVARLKGGPLEYALPPDAASKSTTVYEV